MRVVLCLFGKWGKASFFSIKDKLGIFQIYISINDVGEETYTLFKSADIGDIVGIKGYFNENPNW